MDEHPSPSLLLPSSHAYEDAFILSPQIGGAGGASGVAL
jgi:hypothetical protein